MNREIVFLLHAGSDGAVVPFEKELPRAVGISLLEHCTVRRKIRWFLAQIPSMSL